MYIGQYRVITDANFSEPEVTLVKRSILERIFSFSPFQRMRAVVTQIPRSDARLIGTSLLVMHPNTLQYLMNSTQLVRLQWLQSQGLEWRVGETSFRAGLLHPSHGHPYRRANDQKPAAKARTLGDIADESLRAAHAPEPIPRNPVTGNPYFSTPQRSWLDEPPWTAGPITRIIEEDEARRMNPPADPPAAPDSNMTGDAP